MRYGSPYTLPFELSESAGLHCMGCIGLLISFVSVVETLCAEPSLLVACPPLGSFGKALVARMAAVKGTGGQQVRHAARCSLS